MNSVIFVMLSFVCYRRKLLAIPEECISTFVNLGIHWGLKFYQIQFLYVVWWGQLLIGTNLYKTISSVPEITHNFQ